MTFRHALLAASALVALAPRVQAFSHEPMPALSPQNPCRDAMKAFLTAGDGQIYRVGQVIPQYGGMVAVTVDLPDHSDGKVVGKFKLAEYQVRKVHQLPEGLSAEMRSMMMATARVMPERVPVARKDLMADLRQGGLLVKRTRDASEMLEGEAPEEMTLWLPHHPMYGYCGTVGISDNK